jgi:aminopeptidase YwaD
VIQINFRVMNSLPIKLIFPVLLLTAIASAQKIKKEDKFILANLKAHISYLADDKLEGRRTGSNGENLAMEYISNQFKTIGITPKGTEGYYQPFEINEGKQIGDSTVFIINETALKAGTDFFPFLFSAEKKVEASPAIALQEPEMPWFFDLKEIVDENKANPHFDMVEYIKKNSKKAYDSGATAVILFNTAYYEDQLEFNKKDK